MKIIEGSPQEIKEYLERQEQAPVIQSKSERDKRAFNQFVWRDQTKKHGKHWSNNKLQWVRIEDMNSVYIMNVLRNRMRESSNLDLLENEEFQSLIVNLADKIVEGE